MLEYIYFNIEKYENSQYKYTIQESASCKYIWRGVKKMGNQEIGKGSWKGSAKNPLQKAKSANRGVSRNSKNFSSSKSHHDSLKGNRGNR